MVNFWESWVNAFRPRNYPVLVDSALFHSEIKQIPRSCEQASKPFLHLLFFIIILTILNTKSPNHWFDIYLSFDSILRIRVQTQDVRNLLGNQKLLWERNHQVRNCQSDTDGQRAHGKILKITIREMQIKTIPYNKLLPHTSKNGHHQ